MAHWREGLNPEIKAHFEKLIVKSAQHKESYENAKERAIAQLWTANAIQEKELYELRAKIEILEKAISVLSEKGKLAEQAALKAKFLEKALKEIAGKKVFNDDGIDANKAMREVVSRKIMKEAAESKKEKSEEKEADAETEEEEAVKEWNKEPANSNNHDETILCRHPDIVKEPGYLYYINKEGHLTRVPMVRGRAQDEKSEPEVLHKCGIQRKPEWLYYVDKQMNAARAKMVRKAGEGKKEDYYK